MYEHTYTRTYKFHLLQLIIMINSNTITNYTSIKLQVNIQKNFPHFTEHATKINLVNLKVMIITYFWTIKVHGCIVIIISSLRVK